MRVWAHPRTRLSAVVSEARALFCSPYVEVLTCAGAYFDVDAGCFPPRGAASALQSPTSGLPADLAAEVCALAWGPEPPLGARGGDDLRLALAALLPEGVEAAEVLAFWLGPPAGLGSRSLGALLADDGGDHLYVSAAGGGVRFRLEQAGNGSREEAHRGIALPQFATAGFVVGDRETVAGPPADPAWAAAGRDLVDAAVAAGMYRVQVLGRDEPATLAESWSLREFRALRDTAPGVLLRHAVNTALGRSLRQAVDGPADVLCAGAVTGAPWHAQSVLLTVSVPTLEIEPPPGDAPLPLLLAHLAASTVATDAFDIHRPEGGRWRATLDMCGSDAQGRTLLGRVDAAGLAALARCLTAFVARQERKLVDRLTVPWAVVAQAAAAAVTQTATAPDPLQGPSGVVVCECCPQH